MRDKHVKAIQELFIKRISEVKFSVGITCTSLSLHVTSSDELALDKMTNGDIVVSHNRIAVNATGDTKELYRKIEAKLKDEETKLITARNTSDQDGFEAFIRTL